MKRKIVAVLATVALSMPLTACSDEKANECDDAAAAAMEMPVAKPRPPKRSGTARSGGSSKKTKKPKPVATIKIDDDLFEDCDD